VTNVFLNRQLSGIPDYKSVSTIFIIILMPGKRTYTRAFGGSASRKKQYKRRRVMVRPPKSAYRRSSYRSRNLVTAGFLGIERKFYDTSLGPTALTAPTDATTGMKDPSATSMISTPTQGDGEQQRDGKQICCLYVEINGMVQMPTIEGGVAPGEPTKAFVACVLDTQSNGAQCNSQDIFKNLQAAAGMATIPLRNLLFGKRFRILKQTVLDISPVTATSAANVFDWTGVVKQFKWYIPLNNLKINFNAGTTASIANVIDNSIHMVAYTNSLLGVPEIKYNARLRFIG